jgi:hypothetical protein
MSCETLTMARDSLFNVLNQFWLGGIEVCGCSTADQPNLASRGSI